MAKEKKAYADVVASVDAHLYNAMYELTAATFGGTDLTDDQRKTFVPVALWDSSGSFHTVDNNLLQYCRGLF